MNEGIFATHEGVDVGGKRLAKEVVTSLPTIIDRRFREINFPEK
jgi:hypothetical protein